MRKTRNRPTNGGGTIATQCLSCGQLNQLSRYDYDHHFIRECHSCGGNFIGRVGMYCTCGYYMYLFKKEYDTNPPSRECPGCHNPLGLIAVYS